MSDVVWEPRRATPVAGVFDVVVAGGGPAGVAAAVAAGRSGASVLLLEGHGCLGGIWTAGALCWLLDHRDKPGLMREITDRLSAAGGLAVYRGRPTNAYDPELMKLLLEQLVAEAQVHVRLHTRLAAGLPEAGRLTHVLTESKSGREAWAAQVFVDATGDGDLSARVGCRFEFGCPASGRTQPMSLMALVTGVTAEDVGDYYREDDSTELGPPKDRLRAAMERGGASPSYAKPTLFRVRDGLFALMANHEYGVSGLSADDLTVATRRARSELHGLINGLRSLGGVWRDIRLVATAAQIGVREGRRIRGLYQVTADDLRLGARHPDAVCRVTFPIDVHATDPTAGKGIETPAFRSKPYDIPLRALIAADVDGLVLAGRCLSGDFLAHSSYRVTGNAVATGEAAGRLAAVAARLGQSPREVPFAALGLPPLDA